MAELLKNRFGPTVVRAITDALSDVYPELNRSAMDSVCALLPALELKDRIAAVADAMAEALPTNYVEALEIVVEASGKPLPEFGHWPYTTFVERCGVDHPSESLQAMEILTRSWTCEFALRPFLANHLEQTMACVLNWAQSNNEHVRRLASEGTRPLLPWAPKVPALNADPRRGIEVLSLLRHDSSEMVRRSVANHLNDVAKSDPDLVADTLQLWTQETDIDQKMVKHALRTMVKQGHPEAMRLLGFTVDAQVAITKFEASPTELDLGDNVVLAVVLTSTAPQTQRLVVDFVIHHPTANAKTSKKVFKWKVLELAAGEQVSLTKARRIQTASTRRYTAGRHVVQLQVAGVVLASSHFDLRQGSAELSSKTIPDPPSP